jgi:hypothetical protein
MLAGAPILKLLESTTTLLVTAITNPCNPKVCVRPGSGHQAVLSNPLVSPLPPCPLLQRLRTYFHRTHKFGFTLLSPRA